MSDEYKDRKYPRVRVKGTVDVSSSDLLLFNEIENISLGGLCIRTATPERIGQKVELVFNFPETGQELELHGEVAWISDAPDPVMGVRFLDMDDERKKELEQYLYSDEA